MTFDVHFGSWLCENSSARRALRNISTGWARNCQSGLAQLGQYMTRVEAADAVVLDMSIRATVFSRTGSLLGRRHGLEQIQEPVRADVVSKLQHQWLIAPELVLQTVGEADVLNLELLVNARPFPKLDDGGLGDGKLAECPPVGPEAVRQHSASRLSSLAPETLKRSRKR